MVLAIRRDFNFRETFDAVLAFRVDDDREKKSRKAEGGKKALPLWSDVLVS